MKFASIISFQELSIYYYILQLEYQCCLSMKYAAEPVCLLFEYQNQHLYDAESVCLLFEYQNQHLYAWTTCMYARGGSAGTAKPDSFGGGATRDTGGTGAATAACGGSAGRN
jgi:hypothetical protein